MPLTPRTPGAALGRRMKLLISVILAIANASALACTCTFLPLGNEQANAATEIFVFRLVSAVADTEDSGALSGGQVTGTIRIVDVLRGNPQFTRMRYSTTFCCGSRIDVGQYYVAFTSASGTEFSGDTGSLLNFGEQYVSTAPEAERLRAVESGDQTLEQAFGEFPNDRMFTLPRPPPPCPNGPNR